MDVNFHAKSNLLRIIVKGKQLLLNLTINIYKQNSGVTILENLENKFETYYIHS